MSNELVHVLNNNSYEQTLRILGLTSVTCSREKTNRWFDWDV